MLSSTLCLSHQHGARACGQGLPNRGGQGRLATLALLCSNVKELLFRHFAQPSLSALPQPWNLQTQIPYFEPMSEATGRWSCTLPGRGSTVTFSFSLSLRGTLLAPSQGPLASSEVRVFSAYIGLTPIIQRRSQAGAAIRCWPRSCPYEGPLATRQGSFARMTGKSRYSCCGLRVGATAPVTA